MVAILDFEDKDGSVDWVAYKEAKINNGEECYECGAFLFDDKKYRHRCYDCKSLTDDTGSVIHNSKIRCPKCRDTIDVDSELYEIYKDGLHEVTCWECDHNFDIETRVSYTFESPELLQDG